MLEGPAYDSAENTAVAACPTCDGVVEVHVLEEGTELECPTCGELLMIAAVEPLTLAVATDPDEVPFADEDERRE